MATVEEVGEIIRANIRAARAEGFSIRQHIMLYISTIKQCCAVGSTIRDLMPGDDLYQASCDRLGVGLHEVVSIARGFDGTPGIVPNEDLPEWYGLGATIRVEVLSGLL